MMDRDAIIKGFATCYEPPAHCDDCPYCELDDCWEILGADALKLLREQDPVKPKKDVDIWRCGNCGCELPVDANYCKHCGRAIEWKETEMEEEKETKYVLTGHIETDGDFSINMNKMGAGDSIDYHDGFDRFIKLGDHCYDIDLRTDDVYLVRDFLKELIVSFDVTSAHYYMLGELYHMVEDVLDDVFINYIGYSVGECSGNYEGTKLELVKNNV